MEIKTCNKCGIEFFRKDKENSTTWKRRKYCSRRCSRLGKKISEYTKNKISFNRKGKGIGNKNGKGKNMGNKNAFGKVSGNRNGNWKGGVSNKELLAGRRRSDICEICGAFGKTDFDHCHKTGKFRGWICRRCNLALGLVKDSSDLLYKLADYLNVFSINNGNKKDISS